jgi:subtilisin family serine protease
MDVWWLKNRFILAALLLAMLTLLVLCPAQPMGFSCGWNLDDKAYFLEGNVGELKDDTNSPRNGEKPLNTLEPGSFEDQHIGLGMSPEDSYDNYFTVEGEWDFSKVNEWDDIAYANGDLTELVIGVDKAHPNRVDELISIVHQNSGEIVNKVSMGGKTTAVVVSAPTSITSSFAGELQASGLAKYVEPNMKFEIFSVPNDPNWTIQWGPKKIEADYAWNTTIGDPSVLVAVIDTGIDYDHPDLAANYVPLGYDWADNDNDTMDEYGHGTHCAGILAAVMNNNIGIAGLAQVRIMAEKGFRGVFGDEVALAKGIIHAVDQGAKIINMSWGGAFHSMLIYESVKYAYDHGVLLIAAAGNSAGAHRFFPAAYDEVIAVSATNENDDPTVWTTFGEHIELAAPGNRIYSTWWDDSYESKSGTSMACAYVSGVAALIWSQFPNATRDWVRTHLRYTADDLGNLGRDVYYGYGRVNARKAVQPPPEHDLYILRCERPPYVEPRNTGIINTTVLNFGITDESGITVHLLVNGTIVDSSSFGSLPSGTSAIVSCSWTPTTQGIYNVTSHVAPVPNEAITENNIDSAYVMVSSPVKAFVLRSAGNFYTIDAWKQLNSKPYQYGDKLIYIDYTTLSKFDITYEDIAATNADVLIIACGYKPWAWKYKPVWEYTDSEIKAIMQYVYGGHGLIATGWTFHCTTPNNNKLAPLFGIKENLEWIEVSAAGFSIERSARMHPLFTRLQRTIQSHFMGRMGAAPRGNMWTADALSGGTIVATYGSESAIVVHNGLVYISTCLDVEPTSNETQLLYNAIAWSRYTRQDHDLISHVFAPDFVQPSESGILSATVFNAGLNNESNVQLQLLIDGTVVDYLIISKLASGSFCTINYEWTPPATKICNVTAYAPPLPNEEDQSNNRATRLSVVTYPLIDPVNGQWANYTDRRFIYDFYVSPYRINVTETIIEYGYEQPRWWIVNIMNRKVEAASVFNWWEYPTTWYMGWIETNITVGSKVNIDWGTATVVDNQIIEVNGCLVDCWELHLEEWSPLHYEEYSLWYDRASGLLVRQKCMSSTTDYVLESTNIPIGFKNDFLSLHLDAPRFIQFGGSSLLNATVYNLGSTTETNVTLQLLVNSIEVGFTVIPELKKGFSFTLSYAWTPTAAATYNITAYAIPVQGEGYTLNNGVTRIVAVPPIKGHVLFYKFDIDYYGVWIENLEYEGYVVNQTRYGLVNSTLLENYDVLIVGDYINSFDLSEFSAIQDFVYKGGGFIILGPKPGFSPSLVLPKYRELTAFAGIDWVFSSVNSVFLDTNITAHAVTEGVSSVFIKEPGLQINMTSAAAQSLAEVWYDSTHETMLVESKVGAGKVVCFASTQSLQDRHIWQADNLRLAVNMVRWSIKKDETCPAFGLIIGILTGLTIPIIILLGIFRKEVLKASPAWLRSNYERFRLLLQSKLSRSKHKN